MLSTSQWSHPSGFTNLEQVISPLMLAISKFRWCWEACTLFLQSTSHSSQFLVDIKYTYLLNPGLPKRCGPPIAGLAAGIENSWDWELHEDLDVENNECHPSHLVCSLCWEDLENNELNSRRQFWSICPGRFYWSRIENYIRSGAWRAQKSLLDICEAFCQSATWCTFLENKIMPFNDFHHYYLTHIKIPGKSKKILTRTLVIDGE